MIDTLARRLQAALGDSYTLEHELGGAGMSRVFVATEHALGRRVVVKVLPPDLAAGVNKDRFRREIQLAAQLQHPHIVPLLTAGEHGDLLWFTMPFVEGESLRALLDRQGRLTPREVLRLLADVVDALAYAHSRGVVHRDIKPGNVLMSGSHAMITDFGVAKALSAAIPVAGHTTSGMAIGTPAYMAPEQLAADPAADHRVDLYAVGLLAYELLTGASPFTGQSPQATLAAQLTERPTAPHLAHPDVPPPLSAVIMKCLEKDAANRPATAAELLASLRKVEDELSGERLAPPPVPRRAPALLTFAAVAALAATVFVITRGGDGAGRRAPGSDTVGAAVVQETLFVYKDVPVGRDARPGVPLDVVLAPDETLAVRRTLAAGTSSTEEIDRDSLIAAISKVFADSMSQAIARMEAALESQPRQQELQRIVSQGDAPGGGTSASTTTPPNSRAGGPPPAPPTGIAFRVPRTAADTARMLAARAARDSADRALAETITPVMAPPPRGTRRLVILPFSDRSNAAAPADFSSALLAGLDTELRTTRSRLEIVAPDVTTAMLGERPGRPTAVGFALRANAVLGAAYFVRADSLHLVTLLTDVRSGAGTRAQETVVPVSQARSAIPKAAEWVRCPPGYAAPVLSRGRIARSAAEREACRWAACAHRIAGQQKAPRARKTHGLPGPWSITDGATLLRRRHTAASQRERRRFRQRSRQERIERGLHGRQRLRLGDALALHLDIRVPVHTGTGRNEVTDDDVFLETKQVITQTANGGIGEHARGLLERRRRHERLRGERRLGDAEQQRLGGGRLTLVALGLVVVFAEGAAIDVLTFEHGRLPRIDDAHLLQHLLHDHANVLVVDLHALQAVDLLHFVEQVLLHRARALDAQDVVRIHRGLPTDGHPPARGRPRARASACRPARRTSAPPACRPPSTRCLPCAPDARRSRACRA